MLVYLFVLRFDTLCEVYNFAITDGAVSSDPESAILVTARNPNGLFTISWCPRTLNDASAMNRKTIGRVDAIGPKGHDHGQVFGCGGGGS